MSNTAKGLLVYDKASVLVVEYYATAFFCAIVQTCVAQEDHDVGGIAGYKGQLALKDNWRPFNNHSYWNRKIPATADTHPDSDAIINELKNRNYPKEIFLRLGEEWNPTLHVVGSQASKFHYQSRSDKVENGVIGGYAIPVKA